MHIGAGTNLMTLLFPKLLISCQFEIHAAKYFTQNPQIEPNSFSSSNSNENSTLQDFIEIILLRSTMKHQPSMKRSKNRSVK
jgi:hypothetical protein